MDDLILNKVSSEAVQNKTGRYWQEWIDVLDSENCQTMTHKEIVAILNNKYQVGDWWCQMVTVGYEQARGLRDIYQKVDGFSATISKTFPFPVEIIYFAWIDPIIRREWLTVDGYEIKKTTENKIIRIKWNDGSSVEINLYPKGPAKTQLSIQHNKLGSSPLVSAMKSFWSGKLIDLQRLLANQ